jgi:hypothetical protein
MDCLVNSDCESVVCKGDGTCDTPTPVPIDSPTAVPTAQPTDAPTDVPTGAPTAAPTAVPTDGPADAPTGVSTDTPTEAPLISAAMRLRGFSNKADFTPDHMLAFEKAVASAITGVTTANVQIVNCSTSAGDLMISYQINSSNTTDRATAWAATELWGENTTAREVWGDTVLRAAIEADGASVPPGFRVTGATEPTWVDVWLTSVPSHAPTLAPNAEVATAPAAPADDASGIQDLKFELIAAACCVIMVAIGVYFRKKLMTIAGWRQSTHTHDENAPKNHVQQREENKNPMFHASANELAEQRPSEQLRLSNVRRNTWLPRMENLWSVLRDGGVSEEEIVELKKTGWTNFGITSNLGNTLREILIKRVPKNTGKTSTNIENKYAPDVITSYATGNREIDESGDGPGSIWNFLVCLAIDMDGKGMPMTGMLAAQGDFFIMYMKCVDKSIAKALKISTAKHMVVLLSKAFTQSGMCMVEVYTAIQNGVHLVLVNVEEPLDWGSAWPLEQTLARYPFTGGPVR